MEADWEVEIGPDAPLVDAAWPGLIDLERHPERIDEVAEAAAFPPLAQALLRLNQTPAGESGRGEGGPSLACIRTTKCDLWQVADLDPYELDARPQDCLNGRAAYIDLLPRKEELFPDFDSAKNWGLSLVDKLRAAPCPNSRVDLVVRRAAKASRSGLGITAYIAACGTTEEDAGMALARALLTFSHAIAVSSMPSRNREDDTMKSAGE